MDDRLLERLQADFIGLDTHYLCADGVSRRRVYLDSAATSLMLGSANELAQAYLAHHANTHSELHFSARAATAAYAWARQRVLRFIGADPDRYVCLFVGQGATSAINRATHLLAALRPAARKVLVSLIEHHSNDLPHRQHAEVLHIPLVGKTPALGVIDLAALEAMIAANGEAIRYIALSAASNVTGIENPVADVVRAAHNAGLPVLVDISQSIVHKAIDVAALGEPELLAFSGHKAYAPGAPGVLIARRDVLARAAPVELGGGAVERVAKEDFALADDVNERHDAGSPNVVGALALAAVFEKLSSVGMQRIADAEQEALTYLLREIASVPGLRVYGAEPSVAPRVGVVSFNHAELDHGFIAAALNDYHNVAVRNACFCAHPYVRELILPELWALDIPEDAVAAERAVNRRRGMVRASLGLYSTRADVDALIAGLHDIVRNASVYLAQYDIADDGNYFHRTFKPPQVFNPAAWLAEDIAIGEE